MSTAITRGVLVNVEPTYLAERSDPTRGHFLFTYRVTIRNRGDVEVQLTHRHWVITDANGHVEHVKGPGVVGFTPTLAPGEAFEYESFCPLKTSLGAMHGTFRMVPAGGEPFEAEVAPFTLADPESLN